MPPSPPHEKTLWIDLDGTLLNAHTFALNIHFIFEMTRALRPLTGSWWSALRTLGSVTHSLFDLTPTDVPLLTRAKQVYQARTGRSANELVAATEEVFTKLRRHFYPAPGAQEFILWASQRASLVLATNPMWSRNIIELRLRWAGIDPGLFFEISTAETYRHRKPQLEYYQEILDRTHGQPRRCFHIGNEWKQDGTATRLGVPVFIVNASPRVRSVRDLPAGSGSGTFEDLKQVLEKWLKTSP